MNKLKLDLDQLTVESFDTNASGITRRGTVRGHSDSCFLTDCQFTCADTCNTCGASCGGGCGSGYSCGGTCGGTCVDPSCNTCFTNCEQVSCGVIQCP